MVDHILTKVDNWEVTEKALYNNLIAEHERNNNNFLLLQQNEMMSFRRIGLYITMTMK